MNKAELTFSLTQAWGTVAVRADQYKASPSSERKAAWEAAYLAWEKIDNQLRKLGA